MSGGDGCQQSNLFFFMEMGARRFHAAERKYIMFKTSVWFPCTKNPDEIGDSNSCYSQIVSSSGLKPPFANRNCCYQSYGSGRNAYYSQMVSLCGLKHRFANRNRCYQSSGSDSNAYYSQMVSSTGLFSFSSMESSCTHFIPSG